MGEDDGIGNGLEVLLESVRFERKRTVRMMMVLFIIAAVGLTVYAVIDKRENHTAVERILEQIKSNKDRVANIEHSVGIEPPEEEPEIPEP